MAVFGAAASGSGGSGQSTTVDTGNLAVTGSDLALICGAGNAGNDTPTMTLTWDQGGVGSGPYSMTGVFDTVNNAGGYVDSTLAYLDNPEAVTGVVRVTAGSGIEALTVGAVFATAAGDFVGTDTDTVEIGGAGSNLDATVPNAVTGDLLVDHITASAGSSPTLTVGASQTEVNAETPDAFTSTSMSYQDGASALMDWNLTAAYGAILIAGRIPDAGGGGGTVHQVYNRLNEVKFKQLLGR